MIPEIGHFALILCLALSIVQGVLPLVGAAKGNRALMAVARPAAAANAFFGTVAIGCLAYSFYLSDFTVLNVANNSNSLLPWYYKVAATWGSHEGSILFWTVTLGWWGAAVAFCARRLPAEMVARVTGVLGLVGMGFLLFMLLTSNPFLRLFPAPAEGADLNPLLQDPGMVFHPPLLYLGYVGFAVPFAFAIAALISGRLDAAWARWMRPWTTAAWVLLTLGIALGSYWAYYELGWGGWWFWDPVENASFIPWLTTTALMHALIQTRRRGQLRRLTVFLTLVGFALCLLGTFLVRSGAMQSVHAFATDPGRGIALQVLAIVLLVPAAFLYCARIEPVCRTEEAPMNGSDALMTGAVFLLMAAAFAVLFGTLYPLGYEVFAGRTLTVGAPYFNNFFAPMTLIATALAGAAQLGLRNPVRWAVCAAASVAAGAAVALLTDPRSPVMTGFAVAAAVWLVVTAVSHCLPFPARRMSLAALLAHVGIAVSIVGAVGVEQYESEALVRMGPGLGKPVDDVVFVYTETRFVNNHSYFGQQGVIEVLRLDDESLITTLRPERQTFVANGMQMSAAGIDHGFLRDYYVSMGNKLTDTEWLVRLSIKPLAGWIWGGGAVMILAALIILFTRRRETETAAQELEAPSK